MRKYYRSPICRSCDKKVVYPGALLFSDPTDDDWEEMISPNVQKTHLCSKCYKNIIYAIDGGRFR